MSAFLLPMGKSHGHGYIGFHAGNCIVQMIKGDLFTKNYWTLLNQGAVQSEYIDEVK